MFCWSSGRQAKRGGGVEAELYASVIDTPDGVGDAVSC